MSTSYGLFPKYDICELASSIYARYYAILNQDAIHLQIICKKKEAEFVLFPSATCSCNSLQDGHASSCAKLLLCNTRKQWTFTAIWQLLFTACISHYFPINILLIAVPCFCWSLNHLLLLSYLIYVFKHSPCDIGTPNNI